MLLEAIRTIVLIEGRIHDIALVLTAAALSDPGAAAALHDRLEVKRAAIRAALTRVQEEGGLSSAWQLEEAVDVLAALLSVDSYQQLVVEQRWQPEQLISRILQLGQAFLVVPQPRKGPREPLDSPCDAKGMELSTVTLPRASSEPLIG